jgi:hypothetical protein
MRPWRAGAAALSLGLALSLAGCGHAPSARQWAAQVCGVLGSWRAQITALNTEAQKQMAQATTPEQTRDHLLTLLAGGERASETARSAVVAAGTPAVSGGAEVAARFAAALEVARDAYAHARTDLQALPTQDAKAFYDGVVSIMTRLADEYAHTAAAPNELDSPDMRAAFDGVDQCR